jgi:hypothetical protein
MQELIDAVKTHANQNYHTGGWDFVVECWEDHDIAEAIAGATNADQAIRRVQQIAKTLDDHRQEVQSEIW